MVDYNPGLNVDKAFERYKNIGELGPLWIEEQISPEMLERAADLTKATNTPIQLGENFW